MAANTAAVLRKLGKNTAITLLLTEDFCLQLDPGKIEEYKQGKVQLCLSEYSEQGTLANTPKMNACVLLRRPLPDGEEGFEFLSVTQKAGPGKRTGLSFPAGKVEPKDIGLDPMVTAILTHPEFQNLFSQVENISLQALQAIKATIHSHQGSYVRNLHELLHRNTPFLDQLTDSSQALVAPRDKSAGYGRPRLTPPQLLAMLRGALRELEEETGVTVDLSETRLRLLDREMTCESFKRSETVKKLLMDAVEPLVTALVDSNSVVRDDNETDAALSARLLQHKLGFLEGNFRKVVTLKENIGFRTVAIQIEPKSPSNGLAIRDRNHADAPPDSAIQEICWVNARPARAAISALDENSLLFQMSADGDRPIRGGADCFFLVATMENPFKLEAAPIAALREEKPGEEAQTAQAGTSRFTPFT